MLKIKINLTVTFYLVYVQHWDCFFRSLRITTTLSTTTTTILYSLSFVACPTLSIPKNNKTLYVESTNQNQTHPTQ